MTVSFPFAVSISRHYTKGKAFPPLDTLVELSNALGKSIDWLCYKKEDSTKVAHLETVGDVIRVLEQLLSSSADIQYQKRSRPSWYNPFSDDPEPKEEDWISPAILFRGGELERYFNDSDKLKQLVSAGTIDQDLYDRWHASQLRDLDHVPLEPAGSDDLDGELPF